MNNTLLTLAVISACSLTTAAQDALLRDSLPTEWVLEQSNFQTTPSEDKWWDTFGDATLRKLIDTAVANNFNVLAAQQRIESARLAGNLTKAGYYPTLGLSAGWSQQQTSGDMQAMKSHAQTMSYFNLGLTMNWEIDVFGRIMAQSKADKANYEASVADYDAVLVSLCGNLAKAYFQLRMAQAEQLVAERNIENANELLRIAKTRYEVGLVPSVDEIQAEIVVLQTKASLPALKADITTAINQIAILIGEYPDKLDFLTTPAGLPAAPIPGVVESPQSLLRRRPDIVAAEKQLAATAARVGIAKKDFLPTLSLTAGVGTEAHNLKDLFGSGSLYYSVMPTLSWTIFDGLSRKIGVAQAKVALQEGIDNYNQTVMTAVSEVNNAMAQWQSSVEQGVIYKKILNDARKELTLQVDRYKQGLCDFTDVANAQTAVLQYENSVISVQAQQLAAVVTVYTALGGGW